MWSWIGSCFTNLQKLLHYFMEFDASNFSFKKSQINYMDIFSLKIKLDIIQIFLSGQLLGKNMTQNKNPFLIFHRTKLFWAANPKMIASYSTQYNRSCWPGSYNVIEQCNNKTIPLLLCALVAKNKKHIAADCLLCTTIIIVLEWAWTFQILQ